MSHSWDHRFFAASYWNYFVYVQRVWMTVNMPSLCVDTMHLNLTYMCNHTRIFILNVIKQSFSQYLLTKYCIIVGRLLNFLHMCHESDHFDIMQGDVPQFLPDTTLLVHFFGRRGRDTLRYEDFHR